MSRFERRRLVSRGCVVVDRYVVIERMCYD